MSYQATSTAPPDRSVAASSDGPETTTGHFGFATIDLDGKWVAAVVTDRGAVPLARLLGATAPTSVRGLLDNWDSWCDAVATALLDDLDVKWSPSSSVTFGPPLPDPTNLYMAGANYYDHIAEMGGGAPDKSAEDVFHFMVPTHSLVGTGHDVVRPAGVEKLDWEVELAVVIGRATDGVAAADALSYVAGYAVANDVSVRDKEMYHPVFGIRFLYAKGQATLTPMGPVIVPARFVPDPMNLNVSLSVNGTVRQHSSTAQMIWSIPEQIAFLSSQAPLSAGDVILTGTPAGTAAAHPSYLVDGDVMTARIDGVGELTNTVVGTRH